MPDNAERFENTIEGVTGLTRVHDPIGYENVQVFSGEFGKSESRPINLRVLPSNKTNTSLAETFLATARSWRKVATHPNVVEVIEWNDKPDPWMIVVDEYNERLVRHGGERSLSEVSEIVSAIAEALRNAALYNVSHLNLRPEYIRFSENSTQVQVDDWGLERSIAEDSGRKYVTAYTAPEQLDSSPSDLDKRTDVYGLAGLAYFALTGTPPVTPHKQSILQENPIPPSELADNIPEGLDDFLLKSLDKSPDSRPDNPFILATQFEQAADPTQSQRVVGGASKIKESDADATNNDVHDEEINNVDGSTIDHTDDLMDYDRRTIFKAGTLLIAVIAIGALSSRYLSSNSADSVIASVPPKIDFINYIDLSEILSNEALEQNLSQELSVSINSSSGDIINDLVSEILPSVNLDFQRIDNVVAFGRLTNSPSQYFALIIRSDWNSDTVLNALKQAQVSLNENKYMEVTLYKIDSKRLPWTVFLAFLEDDEFVLGTRTEVEDVITRHNDAGDTPDGEARQGFQSASQAPVRLGFELSESMVSQFDTEYSMEQLVDGVNFGYGSIQNMPELPIALSFRAASNSAASELENQLNAIILLLHDRGDQFISDQANIQAVLENTELRREEDEVSLDISKGLELLSIGFNVANRTYL